MQHVCSRLASLQKKDLCLLDDAAAWGQNEMIKVYYSLFGVQMSGIFWEMAFINAEFYLYYPPFFHVLIHMSPSVAANCLWQIGKKY